MSMMQRFVKMYLDRWNWVYSQCFEGTILAPITVKNATYPVIFKTREDPGSRFVIYALCPEVIPKDKRFKMSEFVTKANFGLAVGNLELDIEIGELRYKVSNLFQFGRLYPKLLEILLMVTYWHIDYFYPEILALCFADKSVDDALAICRLNE